MTTNRTDNDYHDFSDDRLFNLCRTFGAQALEARRKFLGLLPEVNRRRLYEKKGFSSIFTFAAQLGGISEDQVRLTLNLEQRFKDKPVLQNLLIQGEVSINKLARVVSIATADNQEELAEQVKILPNRALETFVRDEKVATIISTTQGKDNASTTTETMNGFQKSLIDDESLHVQTLLLHNNNQINQDSKQIDSNGKLISMKIGLKIDKEVIEELYELQQKGIDINNIISKALEKRRIEIAQKKEASNTDPQIQQNITRYIPVRIKNIIKMEHGVKCSVATCGKPSKIIHHTSRFKTNHAHDPHFLAPLCKEHHIIAHSADLIYWRKRGKYGRK